MKLLIQKVQEAKVEVDQTIVGKIQEGLLVFLGITHTDTMTEASWLINKLIHLRIFEDETGKLNLSLLDKKGSLLIISQFTLYADCDEGRRPSFIKAAPPDLAKPLYEQFIAKLKEFKIPVETGVFGAHMKVSLVNDGPVTILLEKEHE